MERITDVLRGRTQQSNPRQVLLALLFLVLLLSKLGLGLCSAKVRRYYMVLYGILELLAWAAYGGQRSL